MTSKIYLLLMCLAAALADNVDIQEFTAGSSLFNSEVYSEILVDNNENILVSPFSAETILALTQTGALGETAREIRSKLHLPDSEEDTESLIRRVLPKIKSDQYLLTTANKVYVEDSFLIREQFRTTVTDVYQAQFQNIEFAQNVQAAAEINKWVEEETNNKIHNLVTPDGLDESTRLILINALYFQGNWSEPFKDFTVKSQFYTSQKASVQVDALFQQSALYNYYESTELDAKFLELPFKGQGASLTIVLPNKIEGIAVLERQFNRVLATPLYTEEYVQVLLPKFKIENTINFVKILQRLGVNKAFDPSQADFSGIAGSKGDLIINSVVQKTFINVNEYGVEAAAATSVVVGATAVHVAPEATKLFIADRPFIFYIKVNDIILFEGRVLIPQV